MRKQFKKTLSLILSLMMIMSIFAGLDILSFAEDDILSYLTYEINDGEVTITDCDESISGDIVIPNTIEGYPVTTIGEFAFRKCDSIISLTIPDNVICVDNTAITWCKKLEKIIIGSGLESIGIGGNFLLDCEKLNSILVDENNENFVCDESGILFNRDKTVLIKCPVESTSNKYVIPDGVIKICDAAFRSNKRLYNIDIPGSVKEIGFAAFEGCKNLKNITIPNSVTVLESNLFYGCQSLKKVSIPDSVVTIKKDVLPVSDDLYIVGSENSVAQEYAESNGLIFLTNDEIPVWFDFIITDGEIEITGCDFSISGDIVIPDAIGEYPITKIGAMAFSGCSNIQSLKIGNNVNTIYEYAFYGCDNLTNIYIPASVTNIWEEALLNIKNVEKFIVDKENKNYSNDESGALFNKEKTKLIQYPAGNKSETYSIPETVEKIGYFAFSGVSYLKEVYIPAKVSDISESLFTHIQNIEKIIVDKNNETYESDENGVLFNKGKDFLLQYPAGKPDAEYVVPEDAAFSIDAFYNCKNLKTITISQFSQSHFSNLAIGFIKTANTLTKIEGFTIKSFKGSLAEEYAATFGFNFIAIEEYPEEPPAEEPPVDNPPVDNPPVDEPPVEEPAEDGKLDVKGEGGITTDFENNISQIAKEQTVETLSEMINNENFAIVDKNGKALTEKDLVGTGSKIQILDKDGNVVNEYTVLVPTDIDGNGKTTAADARLALRASAQLDNLEGVYATAADAVDDDKITASDARKILRISAGLE